MDQKKAQLAALVRHVRTLPAAPEVRRILDAADAGSHEELATASREVLRDWGLGASEADNSWQTADASRAWDARAAEREAGAAAGRTRDWAAEYAYSHSGADCAAARATAAVAQACVGNADDLSRAMRAVSAVLVRRDGRYVSLGDLVADDIARGIEAT